MTLMRIRHVTSCPKHQHALVVLEDLAGAHRLAFYSDRDDTRRLARELARGPAACHPIFDFIQTVLSTWHAAPVRVVLEDVEGNGVGALVYLRQGEIELTLSCYPPDALTLALRTGVPIYATAEVLAHADAVSTMPADGHETTSWLEGVRPQDFEM